jgi:hypothetical protein
MATEPQSDGKLVEGRVKIRKWNPLRFMVVAAATVGVAFVTVCLNCFSSKLYIYDASPRVNFDAFATAVDENYAFFDLRGVDWQNITAQYEHLVDEGTSDDSLFDYFCEMYKPLQDPDTYLIKVTPPVHAPLLMLVLTPAFGDLRLRIPVFFRLSQYSPCAQIPDRKEGIEGVTQFTEGISIGVDVDDQIERICVSVEREEVTKVSEEESGEVTVDSLPLLEAINTNYLGGKGTFLKASDKTTKMLYGMIAGEDIGYINILSMGGYSVIGNDEQVVRQMLDGILDALACPSGGIILDVRFNNGGQWSESSDINNLGRYRGYDAVSRALVSHFVESKQLLYMSQTRIKGTEEYSELTEFYADSDPIINGHGSYIGPVVLLQSRGTFSAADVFTLAMQTLPNVTSIGTPSAGYYSGVLNGKLPNGWWYGLSNQRYYNSQGTIYEGKGTPVDITVSPAVNASRIKIGEDEPIGVALRVLRNRGANMAAQCSPAIVSGGVTAMLVLSGVVILIVITMLLWPSCYRRQRMVRAVVAFSCLLVLVFATLAEAMDMPRLALPVIMVVALPISTMYKWRCCDKKSRKSFHAGRMLLQVCALGLWLLTWPVAVLAVVEPISGMGAFAGVSASISIALFALDFHFMKERESEDREVVEGGGGKGGGGKQKKRHEYFVCSSFEELDDDDEFEMSSMNYARRAALHCNRAAGGPGTAMFVLVMALLSVFVIALALGAEVSYSPEVVTIGEPSANYDQAFMFPKAPLLFAAVIIITTTIVVLEGMHSSSSCRWLCCDCFRRHSWLPYRCGAYHRALFYQCLAWLSCLVVHACFLVTSIRGLVYNKPPVGGAMAMIGVCGVSSMICMAVSVHSRVSTLRLHSPRQKKTKGGSHSEEANGTNRLVVPLSALTINTLWDSETAGVQQQFADELSAAHPSPSVATLDDVLHEIQVEKDRLALGPGLDDACVSEPPRQVSSPQATEV